MEHSLTTCARETKARTRTHIITSVRSNAANLGAHFLKLVDVSNEELAILARHLVLGHVHHVVVEEEVEFARRLEHARGGRARLPAQRARLVLETQQAVAQHLRTRRLECFERRCAKQIRKKEERR